MRRILFWLLIFTSSGVAAQTEYYWLLGSGGSEALRQIHFDSPREVCDALRNYYSDSNWIETHHAKRVSETRFDCLFSGGGQTDVMLGFAGRFGDACREGAVYNPETGTCDQDCSDTIGQHLLVRGPDSPIFTSNGVNYVLASASDVDGTCAGSCRYDPLSSFAGSCYLVAGSTDTGYCNYIVTGTGDSCSTHNLTPGDMSGDPLNAPDPGDGGGDGGDPDEPDQPDPCHGVPGFTWNGSTCVNTGGGDGDGDGSGDGDGDGNGGGSGPGGPGTGDGGGDGDGSGDGDGDGNGGGGSGPGGPGTGEGDGDGPEGETLDPCGENCEYSEILDKQHFYDSVPELTSTAEYISYAFDQLSNAVEQSLWREAIANVQIPAGTCPTFTLDLAILKTAIPITEHCTIVDGISWIIALVFKAFWIFVAIRIFLEA